MLLLYALKEAYQSLNTHKFRTLSMGFGVCWALFMLVLLLGIGSGFHNGISKEFTKYGEKTMVIWADGVAGRANPIPAEMGSNLAEQFRNIQHVSPMFLYNNPIKYKDKVEKPIIFGIDLCYPALANMSIKEGRFFTARDEAVSGNICIIGSRIKQKLFEKEMAIGKYILVGNSSLQVVGLLDESDVNDAFGESNAILVLNSFFKKAFRNNSRYIDFIRLTLLPTANEDIAEAQFRSYFARHLNFDVKDKKALGIFSMTKAASKMHNFF